MSQNLSEYIVPRQDLAFDGNDDPSHVGDCPSCGEPQPGPHAKGCSEAGK